MHHVGVLDLRVEAAADGVGLHADAKQVFGVEAVESLRDADAHLSILPLAVTSAEVAGRAGSGRVSHFAAQQQCEDAEQKEYDQDRAAEDPGAEALELTGGG